MLPGILHSASHSRFNPLTGEWVLVSPHRLQRPWQGESFGNVGPVLPPYEPDCYLCPGNQRATGEVNPNYKSIFTFDNDFPAVQTSSSFEPAWDKGLFAYRPEFGQCKVICFDPAHNRTLADLGSSEIQNVVCAWMQVQTELDEVPEIQYVEIFENKGAMMGCSNPHPHCQVWATSSIPFIPKREDESQLQYFKRNGSVLLKDYLDMELDRQARMVCDNEQWAAVVPFWAVWPYEILLLPRFAIWTLSQLKPIQQVFLADILKDLLGKYDRLFQATMPYSMGWHGAPSSTLELDKNHWLLHAHYYPPLLRSASVRKFLVGFEMLAQPQRDITPERAAEELRAA